MTESMSRSLVSIALLGLVATGAFALAGCGEETPPPPCQSKTCQFGVCSNADGGECVNQESCGVDRDCLPGYLCGADNTCQPQSECGSDADCDQGVCDLEAGVCVNPDSCGTNEDCVARTFCSQDGQCRPDPCNEVNCDRGVCKRGTEKCVSASSCTPETQALDCVAGQKCIEQSCRSRQAYCNTMACERGVCSYAEETCVNAQTCSADAECVDGFFCNDMSQCQRNLCDYNNVSCEKGSECVPASGECQTTAACETSAGCKEDPKHVCVDGACRLESAACGEAAGDGGCPGNRVCEYDADNQTATCEEPETCQTTIDCDSGRQCNGRTCIPNVACAADIYEPNDTADGQTSFGDFAEEGALEASLCAGDTDRFGFETTDIVSSDYTGQMQVELTIPERDIGHGDIEVRLLDDEGSEVAAETLAKNAEEGHLRLSAGLGSDEHGSYAVAVGAEDSMSGAGVGYTLSINMVEAAAVQACGDAEEIEIGESISGTTKSPASTGLGSSCTTESKSAGESIYRVEVDTAREVTVEATPQLSTTDLSVAVRSRCTQPSTERACAQAVGAGSAESLTTVLGEGTHYIAVQSAAGAAGGPFDLAVSSGYKTRCAPGDGYCTEAGESMQCAEGGGTYKSASCGSTTCHPSSGECRRPEGDVCVDATSIDSMFSQTVSLGSYANSYEIASGGCLGDIDTMSDGPDRTYRVEVPARTDVTVEATYQPMGVAGSIYFVESCPDVESTCVRGARDTQSQTNFERMTYKNESMQSQTRLLVVDVGADQMVSGVDLQVSFQAN